jgi:hypothetical protein
MGGSKGETTNAKPKKVQIKPATAEPEPAIKKGTKAPMSYEDWGKLDAKLKKMDLEADDEDTTETAEQHKAT